MRVYKQKNEHGLVYNDHMHGQLFGFVIDGIQYYSPLRSLRGKQLMEICFRTNDYHRDRTSILMEQKGKLIPYSHTVDLKIDNDFVTFFDRNAYLEYFGWSKKHTRILDDHMVDWSNDSSRRASSNPSDHLLSMPYQKIISMGMGAVPFILEQIRDDADQNEYGFWFWALNVLTGIEVKHKIAGDLKTINLDWIKLGKDMHLLEEKEKE